MKQYDRVWAIVDLDAILSNIESMRRCIKTVGIDVEQVGIYAAVKADAYGHGLVPVARAIESEVKGFAVATVDEGLMLRNHKISKPILVLSTPNERRFSEAVKNTLSLTVYTLESAGKISDIAVTEGKTAVIHLAVDTGMSRVGMMPTEEMADMVRTIVSLPGLYVEGIFTHFAKADEKGGDYSCVQRRKFMEFLDMLKNRGISIPIRHMSNSAATLILPELTLDAVRVGISLYGLSPTGIAQDYEGILKPALELKSEITYIKEIEAGTPVSYGGIFVAGHRMKVATIPIGYGDGYPRNLSGKGYVLIKGEKAPILGRVCMDQLMVDVTDMDVLIGDEVTLIGRDGAFRIGVEDLAAIGGGFHYEIICALGKRVPRIYRKDGKVTACKDYFSDQF